MIRFVNTRTGRETVARDGKDAAVLVRAEQDTRFGLEVASRKPLPWRRGAELEAWGADLGESCPDDAYDPGDPKRGDYLERADRLRDELRDGIEEV